MSEPIYLDDVLALCDHYTAHLSEAEWEAHMDGHAEELRREVDSMNANALLATDGAYQ